MLKSEKGLTLIEVLASIVMFSIITVSFMNIIGSTTLSTLRIDDKKEEIRIAEQELKKRLQIISSSAVLPNVESQNAPSYTVNNYDVVINETKFPDSPSITATTNNSVSLQAIIVLMNGSIKEQRLLTVTVSKREN
jgi:prepilin-type N-terminal cleavage/methylation domain-containing protein